MGTLARYPLWGVLFYGAKFVGKGEGKCGIYPGREEAWVRIGKKVGNTHEVRDGGVNERVGKVAGDFPDCRAVALSSVRKLSRLVSKLPPAQL